MIQLILMLSMSAVNTKPVAQVQPCSWPRCQKSEPVVIAQVQPCSWPRCQKPEPVINL
ncbi:MAG TPA: hypothetical protein VFA38_11455 [Nitrospirales bacterium]|nr:hypothetical protein [Nitrospirales bacterium]